MGLVDGLMSPDDLVNTACQWALDIMGRRRPWIASLYKTDKLEPLGEAREILVSPLNPLSMHCLQMYLEL